jgi:multiple sugar transport system permease protein/raffinose/stachyose/melibiose transport system permease protein
MALRLLTRRDKVVLVCMAGVPTLLTLGFVWLPALASVALSFTNWNGVSGLGGIHFIGTTNYHDIFTTYPLFWPAVRHNLLWLGIFFVVPAPLGLFLATQLDKKIRFTRVYQSVLFLPVVVSLALIGFITELIFSPTQGLINNLAGTANGAHPTDWLGNPHLDLWAVLIMACWRQTGYVMILFLAGLKSVDPSLREAAALDGANEWQAFRHVVFPALKPLNIVVVVVTVIESLRAFDIVYVVNKGTNGLELLSVLITQNIIGEASRIGYGSTLAVILLVISLGFIVPYLLTTFRKDQRP